MTPHSSSSELDRRVARSSAAVEKSTSLPVRPMRITVDGTLLTGELAVPPNATGVVLFAHGRGGHTPADRVVAEAIQAAGQATVHFGLLSPEEFAEDENHGQFSFNLELLAQRLIHAVRWINQHPETRDLGIGCFGAGTGGAAAMLAAVELGPLVQAIVSQGGRPDLLGDDLARVLAPTLLIVGEYDEIVLGFNENALDQLTGERQLALVPGATHLLEEPGALDEVAQLAVDWFARHLRAR